MRLASLILTRKNLGAGCWALFLLVALGPWTAVAQGTNQAALKDSRQDSAVLAAADKSELEEALRLKTELGDRVWPGLGGAEIPIILYNESYEFLVGEKNPEGSWEVVQGEDFLGNPYYRRTAGNPQSFAVFVGGHWAGSIATLELMNRKIPVKLTPDYHVVAILHEVFHAYQATIAPGRFAKAKSVYALESRYPLKDRDFAAAWTREGATLAEAIRATDNAEAAHLAQKFLQIRKARREQASLGPELLGYECELEWLEGLAEFVGIKFYELAASGAGKEGHVRYRPRLHPFLQADFIRLERQLGRQDGDLRFYLSGLAQARLLDRLSPGWQAKAMEKGIYLEELLGAAVGPEKLPQAQYSAFDLRIKR